MIGTIDLVSAPVSDRPGGAPPPRHRFIIVDDHPLFRDALANALRGHFAGARIDEAGSYEDLVPLLASRLDPDIVFLDLNMPGVHGLSGLMLIRAEHPTIPVVIVSANDDPVMIRRCLDCGASGYVTKSEPVQSMREAADLVLAGGIVVPATVEPIGPGDATERQVLDRLSTLTPQQLKVLGMLGEGLLNKQIAHKLAVSEATIKAHVSAILMKLGVGSRTQAVITVGKIGLGKWSTPPAGSEE